MERQDKIKRLKEVLPIFWNSYQHMYDVRERKAKGMIDFLLIVSTFLPMLSIALYSTNLFNNLLILVPTIPQLVSIVILLKYFEVSSAWIYWRRIQKPEDIKLIGDEQEFLVTTISTLKELEEKTGEAMKETGKLIKNSRLLILSSLFLLVLSVLFVLFNGDLILYFSCIILILFSVIVYLYYKGASSIPKGNKVEKESRDLLEKWLQ